MHSPVFVKANGAIGLRHSGSSHVMEDRDGADLDHRIPHLSRASKYQPCYEPIQAPSTTVSLTAVFFGANDSTPLGLHFLACKTEGIALPKPPALL